MITFMGLIKTVVKRIIECLITLPANRTGHSKLLMCKVDKMLAGHQNIAKIV